VTPPTIKAPEPGWFLKLIGLIPDLEKVRNGPTWVGPPRMHPPKQSGSSKATAPCDWRVIRTKCLINISLGAWLIHAPARGDRRDRSMDRRALVTGGTGQDGWYLIEFLLARDYEVHAQSRRPQSADRHRGRVRWHTADISDPVVVQDLIATVLPNEIYNLASVSRPALSWQIPEETANVNALVPQRICEAVLKLRQDCRFFQATSSEIFGDSAFTPQDETTPCCPQTPYGIAKVYAHQTIVAYRHQYGIHASSGIMFNHESPRRPLCYVSQRIAHAAAAISIGLSETKEQDERGRPILSGGKLRLGNLDVCRDFGFAGDYVEAMHLMLQSDVADDYVIGTGESHSIREFCDVAFRHVGRDWRDHVVVDRELFRRVDSHHTVADSSKAFTRFAWRPKTAFVDLVTQMVEYRIRYLEGRSSSM
jgi:GDPmannose 4,6-dehydratase